MKQLVHRRRFDVDFYEEDDGLWTITSHLTDDVHDIQTGLTVSVPDMIVKDASVTFTKYPLEECLAVTSKIRSLEGSCLFDDYSDTVRRLFLGPEGCPNVANLLTTSAPALIYFYFPDQVKNGSMKAQEWWTMCGTKLLSSCIAHRLVAEKYRR